MVTLPEREEVHGYDHGAVVRYGLSEVDFQDRMVDIGLRDQPFLYSNTLPIKVHESGSSTSLTSHPSIHLKSRLRSTARRTESSKPAYLDN
jgi:hypothetical protein